MAARAANLLAEKYIEKGRSDNKQALALAMHEVEKKIAAYNRQFQQSEEKIKRFKQKSNISKLDEVRSSKRACCRHCRLRRW